MGAAVLSWSDLPDGPLWLLSPHLQSWQREYIQKIQEQVPKEKDTVWLLSSGTSARRSVKAVALTREAILHSAASVNQHLEVHESDQWLLPLPTYHIGGFAILARAHLGKNKVHRLLSWKAEDFVRRLEDTKATLSSLVPTQVYDLVSNGLKAPKSLRAIVVGGGALPLHLYSFARSLGWPLLPSYGLTECASQVATATLESLNSKSYPQLKILSHVEVWADESQRLHLRSPALAHRIAIMSDEGFRQYDPRENGWLATEDLGRVQNGLLEFLGRKDEVVKVLGELVSVPAVEREWAEFVEKQGGQAREFVVAPLAQGREGNQLVLFTDSERSLKEIDEWVEAFNRQMPGPQRFAQWCWRKSLPRTELGKSIRPKSITE